MVQALGVVFTLLHCWKKSKEYFVKCETFVKFQILVCKYKVEVQPQHLLTCCLWLFFLPTLFEEKKTRKKIKLNFKTRQSGGNSGLHIVQCRPQIIHPEHKASAFSCPNNTSTKLSLHELREISNTTILAFIYNFLSEEQLASISCHVVGCLFTLWRDFSHSLSLCVCVFNHSSFV